MIDNSTGFKPVKADDEPPSNHEFATGGDITIRSSEDVDFSVHIIVLSLASSAFSDLLSNPTRPDIIKVSETADLIALTLGFIYPKPAPAISSFELLDKALHIANKYHLEGMKSTLRKRLVETGSEVSIYADPLQALAIATSHRFEKEAKMAASVASRDLSFDTPDHLFKLMNAVPLSAPWVRLTGIPWYRHKWSRIYFSASTSSLCCSWKTVTLDCSAAIAGQYITRYFVTVHLNGRLAGRTGFSKKSKPERLKNARNFST